MGRRFILGTAGHIDHGKSTLVQALTGVRPERLEEEVRRGITIELGFARLPLVDADIGVVDVPGHEKFLKTMVAGASGMDAVLMVIAADEGVMPQTREHLDICQLLGVKAGLVVLTRIDRVDAAWLALVEEDVGKALQGTFLEEAKRLAVSALTGAGIDDLQRALQELFQTLPEKPTRGIARLPVDRVFEEKGFGPVATGTLLSGRLEEGAAVSIFPARREARIRGLQVYGKPVKTALAGHRTAVNLQGVEMSELRRGQVLLSSEPWEESREVDVRLTCLPQAPRPFKHRMPLLFHAGTVQIACHLWMPEDSSIPPGSSGFARLRLEAPTLLFAGDPFLLRGTERIAGYGTTVGGGVLLDPCPSPGRRSDPKVWQKMALFQGSPLSQRLLALAEEAGIAGVTRLAFRQRLQAEDALLEPEIAKLLSQGLLFLIERGSPRYISQRTLEDQAARLLETLHLFHQGHPLLEGMPQESLRSALLLPPGRVWSLLLERLEARKQIVRHDDLLRHASHQPDQEGKLAALEERVSSLFQEAGCSALRSKEILERLQASEADLKTLFQRLLKQKKLLRLADDLLFSAPAVASLQERLEAWLKEHEEIYPQDFKALTGTSRKSSIPLAEYFDSIGVTVRIGEGRRLRQPPLSSPLS